MAGTARTLRDRPDRQTLSRLDAGSLVREARLIAGLTQQDLADRTGTSRSTISDWERGRKRPGLAVLGRVLQKCGFEADFVFRRHDDVDRAEIRRLLALTPAERLREFELRIAAQEAGDASAVYPDVNAHAVRIEGP